jgi:hypothetical protein
MRAKKRGPGAVVMMFFFFSFYFVSTTEARIDGRGIFVSSHEKTVPMQEKH